MSKIENNRFCGAVESALMDGEIFRDVENGGTKTAQGKACKTVAKRCIPLCFDVFQCIPELGGFKYQAGASLAVA